LGFGFPSELHVRFTFEPVGKSELEGKGVIVTLDGPSANDIKHIHDL
jgi:hypothetical protein